MSRKTEHHKTVLNYLVCSASLNPPGTHIYILQTCYYYNQKSLIQLIPLPSLKDIRVLGRICLHIYHIAFMQSVDAQCYLAIKMPKMFSKIGRPSKSNAPS